MRIRALGVLLLLSAVASAQELRPGREPIPGAESFLGTVQSPAGYPLRIFVTRPLHASGKLPVIFEVAWLSCDSTEQPKGPEDGFTRLLWDLAGRSGFATVRVDKPGVGESGGPKCQDLDFATELAAYRAAFRAMKDIPFLDTSRIYILGFSNGGGFAPLVVEDAPVRGYMVFSGWYKTWLEHMLELERRRMRLSGLAPEIVNARMKQYATFYDLYLNGRRTPGEIIAEHPEFQEIWYDEPEHQYGRPAAFYYQLQELNLAEAWRKVDVPVLVVHGQYDWIMSDEDGRLLAQALNSHHCCSAEYLVWPTDHLLYVHASEQKAFGRDPDKRYDPKLTAWVLRWLAKQEKATEKR